MNPLTMETIAVVTVTYGDRGHLLKRVLGALTESTVKVDRVVIVDNGARASLENLSSGELAVDVVRLGHNTGSAAGFKAGLERAAQLGCDLIWLLDDDNVPEPLALEAILSERAALGNGDTNIFASLRLDREKYVRVATTDFTLEVRRNAFLGFTIYNMPKWLIKKCTATTTTPTITTAVKKINYGIYGGLLLHRNWITKAGYPNEDFYLYLDDTEYTTRLVKEGAQIYLVPKSKIRDIDVSWFQQNGERLPQVIDLSINTQKLYYTLRNSCFLSKNRFVDNSILFYTNMVSYLAVMFIWGIVAGNPIGGMVRRMKFIIRTILNGLQGELGYKEIINGDIK